MRQKCLLLKYKEGLQLKSTVHCINAEVKHRLQRLLWPGPSSRVFREATKPNGSPSRCQNTHTHRETTHPWPSCLSGWKICPRLLRLGKMGGEEKDKRKQLKTQKGWMEGKAAHSKLGLIYFINQNYKFNLQTRGQKFSLTREPWRTAGLGDHSYYWLHISICLWCSCLLFSLSTIQFFGREVDFNCSYRTRAAFACKPACTSVVRAFLVILGAVHRLGRILMIPPPFHSQLGLFSTWFLLI